MAQILLLNGPNLNLLGTRETAIYGSATLQEIEARLIGLAQASGHSLTAFQSNAEHELIGKVHGAKAAGFGFVIINPGAFTHTSIALRDAFLGAAVPFIEIHLSNLFAREEFGTGPIFPISRPAAYSAWGRWAMSSRSRPPVRAWSKPNSRDT
jgi:3-dehydroquinate dehydratase-2